ncbi:MAG: aldo/keto reductase, partial [Spirochaetales bacterium]|nr:aldo/keto reductase [Spirochaetales bacterium]
MEYVDLGKTGLKVSRFGLGCMRFPDSESEAVDMVRYALDHGVNYLDTAYAYPGSEDIVGRALKDGYREKAVLATKCPVWKAQKPEDLERFLDEELLRLGIEAADLYLLHDMNMLHWEMVQKLEALDFLDRMVQKGKIRHRACSFHGPYEHFQTVLNAYDWEMIQIQLNILDEHNQAGRRGLEDAAAKGIPAVIMEPLRGGALTRFVPPSVRKLMKRSPRPWSLVEWAFRFLADSREVSLVLSGTSELSQLKDNIRIFSDAPAGHLTGEDHAFLKELQAAYADAFAVPCTSCGYCLPCPAGVAIPEIFTQYNMKKLTRHWVDGLLYQRNNMKNGTDASRCIECGRCEERCPQNIPVMAKLREAHKKLGGGII